MVGGFASSGFRDIADCDVYRIDLFPAAEIGKFGLIGVDDIRDYCRAVR